MSEYCHQINFDGTELFARPDTISYIFLFSYKKMIKNKIIKKKFLKKRDKVVKLVGWGLLSTGPTLSSFVYLQPDTVAELITDHPRE